MVYSRQTKIIEDMMLNLLQLMMNPCLKKVKLVYTLALIRTILFPMKSRFWDIGGSILGLCFFLDLFFLFNAHSHGLMSSHTQCMNTIIHTNKIIKVVVIMLIHLGYCYDYIRSSRTFLAR